MPARTSYLPLFAKAQIVSGLFTIVVLAVLYPLRQRDVAAYARAPVCAADTPAAARPKDCRQVVPAEVVRVKCPDDIRPREACQLELRIDGQTRYMQLLRETSARVAPGSQLRVELLNGLPTAAELDGQLVREYGSPETALSMLRMVAVVQLILTLLAAAYLLGRRRRATTS